MVIGNGNGGHIELIVIIAIELDKRLTKLYDERCGYEGEIVDRPWRIPVVCNLIRGHSAEEHSDGLSKWR